MQHHTARYAPVKSQDEMVELMPPPSYIEVQAQPATIETNLGFVLTVANLLITAIIVIAMMVDGTQAKNAIIAGCVYFALTMTGFALVTTGTLSAIVNGWQRERTERQRVQAWQTLGELSIDWRLAVEETRQLELMGRRGSAHPTERVSPLNTYVSAIEDGKEAQSEAVAFAMGLFGTNGKPDAKRVHPDGRLKIRMCGSKRGAGSRDAGRWLLREGIIERVAGGYRLRIDKYPTRDHLQHLL
jgi:hypothetical protein